MAINLRGKNNKLEDKYRIKKIHTPQNSFLQEAYRFLTPLEKFISKTIEEAQMSYISLGKQLAPAKAPAEMESLKTLHAINSQFRQS